jgi:hypothetical protein
LWKGGRPRYKIRSGLPNKHFARNHFPHAMAARSAGYSGTPLPRKLGILSGLRIGLSARAGGLP